MLDERVTSRLCVHASFLFIFMFPPRIERAQPEITVVQKYSQNWHISAQWSWDQTVSFLSSFH